MGIIVEQAISLKTPVAGTSDNAMFNSFASRRAQSVSLRRYEGDYWGYLF
jgi:hypothetical protein